MHLPDTLASDLSPNTAWSSSSAELSPGLNGWRRDRRRAARIPANPAISVGHLGAAGLCLVSRSVLADQNNGELRKHFGHSGPTSAIWPPTAAPGHDCRVNPAPLDIIAAALEEDNMRSRVNDRAVACLLSLGTVRAVQPESVGSGRGDHQCPRDRRQRHRDQFRAP